MNDEGPGERDSQKNVDDGGEKRRTQKPTHLLNEVYGTFRGALDSSARSRTCKMRRGLIMSDAPKSAIDIVMERLRKKDAEAGVEQTAITDAQRAAIAEVRTVYEAQVAERRIMHQSTIAAVFDPAELEERESELRRDLDRFAREREEKINRIRAQRGAV